MTTKGNVIGGLDMMIAATRFNGWTLVTHNKREFRRVPNLHCEDWENRPYSSFRLQTFDPTGRDARRTH